MNRKGGLFLSVIIIIIALAVGFSFGLKFSKQSAISDLESRIAEKDARIVELNDKVDELQIALGYSCPAESAINCMPPIEENLTMYCSGQYHEWIKENCGTGFLF